MRTADLLVDPPYDFKAADTYNNRNAREVVFVFHNKIRCPICKRPTRMSYYHCDNCGADMGIDKLTMERVLKAMMSTLSTP